MLKRIFIPVFVIFAFTVVTNNNSFAGDDKKIEDKGYLGVVVSDLNSTLMSQLSIEAGAIVSRVIEDSPAEEAGILEDDIIEAPLPLVRLRDDEPSRPLWISTSVGQSPPLTLKTSLSIPPR